MLGWYTSGATENDYHKFEFAYRTEIYYYYYCPKIILYINVIATTNSSSLVPNKKPEKHPHTHSLY